MFPRSIDCLRIKGIYCSYMLGLNDTYVRYISTAEIAAALRPFYFAVHPDLFGRYPKQRSVNEESLKHLSAHFEAMKQRRMTSNVPDVLKFYVRNSDANKRDSFKLVRIPLGKTREPKLVIKNLLESCNLSTEYLKRIPTTTSHSPTYSFKSYKKEPSPFTDINYSTDFTNFESVFRDQKKNTEKHLKTWLDSNVETALTRSKGLDGLMEEVNKLQKSVTERLLLKDVRYDCGWNYEHYRGCLKTLERLASLHTKCAEVLQGRIVVFAPFTGVSLEGHIMLFTGDVLNNWLDFIKNIPKHDSFLKKIPQYEVALSQVLRNIKIGHRKFMPKQEAMNYAAHLTKMTTTLLDYLSTHEYPDSWPDDLSDFELVIESESGPLMVNPTGQFIAPSTCPGTIFVDFITNNLAEAALRTLKYNASKHIEKDLHERCIQQLNLKSLTKDDSVTPDKMIQTLERLLTIDLAHMSNIHLHITNFYSVLTDGTVCVPWDFME